MPGIGSARTYREMDRVAPPVPSLFVEPENRRPLLHGDNQGV
jgi:hypothetical protein